LKAPPPTTKINLRFSPGGASNTALRLLACTIRGISTEEVLGAFDQDHIIKPENSNQYARGLLEKADRQFDGVWAQMFLSREDVLKIILPPHNHRAGGGQVELIPISGLTVCAATEKIRGMPGYQSANTCCWRSITYWMDRYPSPVFLSAAPVRDCSDHQHLTHHNGHLIHLDGLHRLIAWGLSGKLDPGQYDKGQGVKAYVAGWPVA
jgi:hypothetical protein